MKLTRLSNGHNRQFRFYEIESVNETDKELEEIEKVIDGLLEFDYVIGDSETTVAVVAIYEDDFKTEYKRLKKNAAN